MNAAARVTLGQLIREGALDAVLVDPVKLVREAGDLRYVRNSAEYRAEAVDAADVEDAISIGDDLGTAFAAAIIALINR